MKITENEKIIIETYLDDMIKEETSISYRELIDSYNNEIKEKGLVNFLEKINDNEYKLELYCSDLLTYDSGSTRYILKIKFENSKCIVTRLKLYDFKRTKKVYDGSKLFRTISLIEIVYDSKENGFYKNVTKYYKEEEPITDIFSDENEFIYSIKNDKNKIIDLIYTADSLPKSLFTDISNVKFYEEKKKKLVKKR